MFLKSVLLNCGAITTSALKKQKDCNPICGVCRTVESRKAEEMRQMFYVVIKPDELSNSIITHVPQIPLICISANGNVLGKYPPPLHFRVLSVSVAGTLTSSKGGVILNACYTEAVFIT